MISEEEVFTESKGRNHSWANESRLGKYPFSVAKNFPSSLVWYHKTSCSFFHYSLLHIFLFLQHIFYFTSPHLCMAATKLGLHYFQTRALMKPTMISTPIQVSRMGHWQTNLNLFKSLFQPVEVKWWYAGSPRTCSHLVRALYVGRKFECHVCSGFAI